MYLSPNKKGYLYFVQGYKHKSGNLNNRLHRIHRDNKNSSNKHSCIEGLELGLKQSA